MEKPSGSLDMKCGVQEVGARYMNLGIDGINSRKEMLLVTLLLFSPAHFML